MMWSHRQGAFWSYKNESVGPMDREFLCGEDTTGDVSEAAHIINLATQNI